jgi:dihydromonapterin reductase/dihydrofolate reductase
MAPTPVALVTGAGRRLGYETSCALLARGFRVFALYRTATDELDKLVRQGATALQVDLSNQSDVQAVIHNVLQQTDRLDALVNNASGFERDATDGGRQLAEQSSQLFQVNSVAPMQLMHGLSDILKKTGAKNQRPTLIVNITDIFAEKPNPAFAAYCSSKAALANLTLSYAALLAPHVRVNAIMPGPIGFLPTHTSEQKQQVLGETLLGREGGFHSVVMQILSLLDNDYITGAQIPVDGGRRLAQGMAHNADGNPG